MQLREMNEQTTYRQQLEHDDGTVVLINQFNVASEDTQRFLEVWAEDAAFMKQQPGYISAQLLRGTAGSTIFINVAVWEAAAALGKAFQSPEFQQAMDRYPESTTAHPAPLRKGRRAQDLRRVGEVATHPTALLRHKRSKHCTAAGSPRGPRVVACLGDLAVRSRSGLSVVISLRG
jgi:quinol monooxygenase YgiN